MQRNCRYKPLSSQPLVLVVCQIQHSRVRQIDRYIPAIQEKFRRQGFPLENSGTVSIVDHCRDEKIPFQLKVQQRWEFRNFEETTGIVVMENNLVVQTSDYTRFEAFADLLRRAVDTVYSAIEHDQLGAVTRIGLRYIDHVQMSAGRDYRYYLQPGLHGLADEVYEPGENIHFMESQGSTVVKGNVGTLVVRIYQNRDGRILTPDLIAWAPRIPSVANAGELVTLIDMDHYVTGQFECDSNWAVDTAFGLHDHIIETFHNHVVTTEAIKEWE